MMRQKIFKAMEEQNNVLKKMGGRLTKLVETRLKKTTHMEIHDDEEGEGWDEREKLITNTVAMKEKMEKMQLAFCKAQGMVDCLYSMGGINSKTPITLPLKFKISNAEKFDETRDPK